MMGVEHLLVTIELWVFAGSGIHTLFGRTERAHQNDWFWIKNDCFTSVRPDGLSRRVIVTMSKATARKYRLT